MFHLPSNIKKIHIIGAVGSGKTTLAKNIARKEKWRHIELDNVVWIRSPQGDIRRSDLDRDTFLQKEIAYDHWVCEGVHYQNWAEKCVQIADLIIFLDPPYRTRIYRVVKRYIRQLLKLEKANYRSTVSILVSMFKWSKMHEKHGRDRIYSLIEPYREKVIVVKSTKAIHSEIKGKLYELHKTY